MNDFLFTQILTELEDAVGRANCSVREIDKVTHSVDYFQLSRMWADRGRRMPEVMTQVAKDRWFNAKNMDCKTIVTENPAEYVALKATCPEGYRVISVEEMILENI